MKAALVNLLALQSLTRSGGVPRNEELDAIAQLRNRLPAALVSAFDQRVASGRPTIAIARQGLCGACHAHVGLATYADLLNPRAVATCGQCGCYLLLAPEEIPEGCRQRAIPR